jgi:hypothetical protein
MADKTEKQIAEEKEINYQAALKMLKSKAVGLAAAYHIGRDDSHFGYNDKSAIKQFIYNDAKNSPEGQEIVDEAYKKSGVEGYLFSGYISDPQIMQAAAGTIQGSVENVKVSDVIALTGKKFEIRNGYAEKYVSELTDKNASKEDQELGEKIIGLYTAWLIDTKVSEAFAARANAVGAGGLEKLLKKPEERG